MAKRATPTKTYAEKLAVAEAVEGELRREMEAMALQFSRQMAALQESLRRSESMRNRQVDVINRLMAGGTIPEEMTRLQQENAALAVEKEDLKQKVTLYKGDRDMLAEMAGPARPLKRVTLSDQLNDTPTKENS